MRHSLYNPKIAISTGKMINHDKSMLSDKCLLVASTTKKTSLSRPMESYGALPLSLIEQWAAHSG
jgi:hypothetical protein